MYLDNVVAKTMHLVYREQDCAETLAQKGLDHDEYKDQVSGQGDVSAEKTQLHKTSDGDERKNKVEERL